MLLQADVYDQHRNHHQHDGGGHQAVTINTINGYTYNQNAPAMEVTPDEDFAAGMMI